MAACEVHHRVDGPLEAPALVLGNSLGSTLSSWDALVPGLAERFRVVRFDLRGHGRSPVPPAPYTLADLGDDVIALLDRLGIHRASYCGVSLGGMIGMWLAAHASDRLERLVLCCTAAHMPPPEAWAERAATVRARGTPAVADAVVSRWFTRGFAARERALVARMAAMIAETPAEGYAACCEVVERMDLRSDLPAITAATLVIAGRDDPATPPERSLEIAEGIAGARLVVLADAAHLGPIEQPEAATRLILEHLDGARAGGPAPAGLRDDDPLWHAGMAVRRAVLGDAHVDRATAATTPFTAAFQDFITRYAWGSVWTRSALDRRTRSCITLAVLTALGREGELAMHVRAARRNGLTSEEIAEVLLHTGVYAGVPASNAAFQVAQRALAEDGDATPQ